MRRREFIGLLGGAAAIPVVARAQQGERVRRIGVLMHSSPNEAEAQARLAAFLQGMKDAGWVLGHNLRIDYRWSIGDAVRLSKDAAELLALGPDVILAGVGATTIALKQLTHTVPIVMAQGIDPVGAGYIDSLARPGGNITGFIQFGFSLSGKWLELLKEVAPAVARVAVLREPGAAGIGQWAIIQSVAELLNTDLKPIDVQDPMKLDRAVESLASSPNGGMIVAVSAASLSHREQIVTLAARHKLPAVYFHRTFVNAGGLLSYGPDTSAQYRRAATYIDRILKGEKAGDLPVQAPIKYELVINLRTAKTLGLEVPLILQQRADDMIE